MGERMKKLENEIEKLESKINILEKELFDLQLQLSRLYQKNCKKHIFTYGGTGHNCEFYKCRLCGKVEER